MITISVSDGQINGYHKIPKLVTQSRLADTVKCAKVIYLFPTSSDGV